MGSLFCFSIQKGTHFEMAVSGKNKRIVVIMIALPESFFSKWQNLLGAHKVKGPHLIQSTATTSELVMNLSSRGILPTVFIQHFHPMRCVWGGP